MAAEEQLPVEPCDERPYTFRGPCQARQTSSWPGWDWTHRTRTEMTSLETAAWDRDKGDSNLRSRDKYPFSCHEDHAALLGRNRRSLSKAIQAAREAFRHPGATIRSHRLRNKQRQNDDKKECMTEFSATDRHRIQRSLPGCTQKTSIGIPVLRTPTPLVMFRLSLHNICYRTQSSFSHGGAKSLLNWTVPSLFP